MIESENIVKNNISSCVNYAAKSATTSGQYRNKPQAQYIPHNQFGQQVVYTNTGQKIVVIGKPPQNGLITASYICSAIGLLVLPFLGPIGFVLALIAQKNGDNRGKGCHDIRWRCDTTIANDNRVNVVYSDNFQ